MHLSDLFSFAEPLLNKWRSDYPSHKKIQLSNLQPNFRFLNDFSIFNFSKEVSFSNFHFKEKVSFEGVEFLQNVDFEGCVFYDDVNFHYVKFKGKADSSSKRNAL